MLWKRKYLKELTHLNYYAYKEYSTYCPFFSAAQTLKSSGIVISEVPEINYAVVCIFALLLIIVSIVTSLFAKHIWSWLKAVVTGEQNQNKTTWVLMCDVIIKKNTWVVECDVTIVNFFTLCFYRHLMLPFF